MGLRKSQPQCIYVAKPWSGFVPQLCSLNTSVHGFSELVHQAAEATEAVEHTIYF